VTIKQIIHLRNQPHTRQWYYVFTKTWFLRVNQSAKLEINVSKLMVGTAWYVVVTTSAQEFMYLSL